VGRLHGCLRYGAAGFVGFLFLLSGCAGVGKQLEPPRAQLANVTVEGVSGLEAVLEVELRLFNTNEVAIEIHGIECELEINDRRLASGVSRTETRIPPFGTVIMPITLYSSVLDMVRRVMELPGRETMDYRLTGKLHLQNTPLFQPSIPFRSTGEISFPRPEEGSR
jgi:LEA14-like dessication related protein